jgi:Chromosome segregation ATPases
MNKCLNVIGIMFVLLLLPYCGRRDAQRNEGQGSGTHVALAEIDSLMWRQADSAFVLLQEFVVGPEAKELDTFDGHYCQLLISELLYKNDCKQTNRGDLLLAVNYFDSLRADAHGVSLQERNVFLDARAHYINGVGYYELGNVVHACAEYLKALELMEEHFEEKELVGKKAQFMTYIYNRLGDMFGEQLLAEPAITCYKQALLYCKRGSTSIYGIPVLLYNLGIQYDVANQKDSAAFYYEKALANLPDYDNIHYRDIITSKSVLAYNLGFCLDSVINSMKYVISLTTDEHERTYRFLTLGNILFESGMYDSSRFYLETVFEQQDDIQSKIVAAENLCSIYQKEGDSVKARKYSSFLADFTMTEIEKKKDVSKINEMFKNHLAQKQEKQAEVNREKAIKKVIKIIIPIAVIIALVIIILAKFRSKNLLKEQQEEADRMLGETEQQYKEELRQRQAEAEKLLEDKEKHYQQEIEAKKVEARKELEERDKQHMEAIEAERQTHRMEQAAITGRLKRKNQEVRELKDQIKQLDDLATKIEVAASFDEEPICRLIMDRVNEGQFKSKIDYIIYKDSALDKQQLLDLRLAVDRHFGQFTVRLKKAYPELTNGDLDYCCLYLLGLSDADIAALMQRTYNTVFERNGKMRKIFGSENPLPITLMGIAKDSSFI